MLLFLPVLCVSALGIAEDKGIQFQHGLRWQEIQDKARAENKYIFMDFYATWCAPCKFMDEKIYPQEEVGKYINDRFVSIRVQADKTEKDSDEVKKWYDVAASMVTQYKVTGFPTYLFFSPDGQLVYKGAGVVKRPAEFIEQASSALRYVDELAKYKKGDKNPAAMAFLARSAKSLGDNVLADAIAADYMGRLKKEEVYTKENIQFARDFTRSSTGKSFDLFYRHADKVNAVMGQSDYAQDFVRYIIASEEVDPILSPSDGSAGPAAPDWNAISAAITHKYGAEYADRVIATAKVGWYKSKKEAPPDYIQSLIAVVERYLAKEPDLTDYMPTALNVNNPAWAIFEHSHDKAELTTAAAWMARVVNANPKEDLNRAFYLDTFANLIYKAGRKADAIKYEEEALKIATGIKQWSERKVGLYESVVGKMKKGEPTWPPETPSANLQAPTVQSKQPGTP